MEVGLQQLHDAPVGWPEDCVYVDGLLYQDKNTVKTVEFESTGNIGLELFFLGKDSPAYQGHEKGRGVRATKDILGGTTIGYYAGVYRPISFAPTNSYVFDVGDGFVIDALEYGNMTRFINDPTATIMYQGPKRSANVETEPVTVMVGRTAFVTIELKTLPCGVKAGEELLMNYHVTDKSYWGPQHVTTIDITGYKNVVVKMEKFEGEQLLVEEHSVDAKRSRSLDNPSLGTTKRTRYDDGLSVGDVLKKVLEAENEWEIIKGLKFDAPPDIMFIIQNADLNKLECLSETIVSRPYSEELEWQFALTMWWRLVKRSCEIFGLLELLRSQKSKNGVLEDRYYALVQEKLNGHGMGYRHAHKYSRLGKFLSEFPAFVFQRQLITMMDWFQQVEGKDAALLDCIKSIVPVSSVFFRDAFHLHRHGFEVYSGLMKDQLSDSLVKFIETRVFEDGVPILNNHSILTRANGNKCVSLPVTEVDCVTTLNETMIRRLAILYPRHEVVSMSQLSKDGCVAQLAHTLYSKKFLKDVDDDQMPLACIVSLTNGTTLDVWPGAIRFDASKTIRRMKITLQAGDVLIFRGDLVHASSSVTKPIVTLRASMTIKGQQGSNVAYYPMHNQKYIVNSE